MILLFLSLRLFKWGHFPLPVTLCQDEGRQIDSTGLKVIKFNIVNKDKYTDFTAGFNDDGKRVDRIIRQFIKEQNLSSIYKAFRKGLIRVNELKIKPDCKVSQGDILSIYKSLLENHSDKTEKTAFPKGSLKDQIIFEDDDLLALNKTKGQLVHGESGSLEELVRSYLKNRIPPSLSFRPGPLHRLDRNTSGLIFFSKSIGGAREFSQQLQEKQFSKFYLALLDGQLKETEIWVDKLSRKSKERVTRVEKEGKSSTTTAYPIQNCRGYTLALIKIESGRTHQIRSQSSYHGYPLSGDKKYGGSDLRGGYFLHSLLLKSKNENIPVYYGNIRAQVNKEQLKRLNRVFSNCTIEELMDKISLQLEDQ